MKATGITHGQRAQNELERLYEKHLIDRVENAGQVADRSRYLYCKDPYVKARKEQIVKAADSKAYGKKLFEKRVPNGGGGRGGKRFVVTRQALKKEKARQHTLPNGEPEQTTFVARR